MLKQVQHDGSKARERRTRCVVSNYATPGVDSYQIRELLELIETYGLYIDRVNEPHYHINLFWSGEDRCWIADVPDLRPCSAHEDTREQAISNIRDAIEGWLEVAREKGFPIPEPRYCPAIYAAR